MEFKGRVEVEVSGLRRVRDDVGALRGGRKKGWRLAEEAEEEEEEEEEAGEMGEAALAMASRLLVCRPLHQSLAVLGRALSYRRRNTWIGVY